jgi:uncharacterized membrane protein YgdD (TMEM256/DUF423 family)
MAMYLRPFLVIQILAFLTVEIWAFVRLRTFGLAFVTKLQSLGNSGYVSIPLPHEMSDYLRIGSLAKGATFFTFTVGFTLALVAFGGCLLLNRYRISRPIRLGWTLFVSAFLGFLFGFSFLGFILLVVFFGLVHLAVKLPPAPFQKVALFALIPLTLTALVFQGQGLLWVRDDLLQIPWGEKMVRFYYRYSPLSAELITPPKDRTQVAIWMATPLAKNEKCWLLRRGIYPISSRKGADLALSGDPKTAAAVFQAVRETSSGRTVKRLQRTVYYSIFFAAPLTIVLLLVLVTDRLFTLSRCAGLTLILCLTLFSAFLIYRSLSLRFWTPPGTAFGESVDHVRQWVLRENKTGDLQARENLLHFLHSRNPALRLWAATALAHLPSRDNVEILKTKATRDPVAIVRCKAIFALSHQGDRGVIPFLESRLKGEEDWYVKHYLLSALRRFGWAG